VGDTPLERFIWFQGDSAGLSVGYPGEKQKFIYSGDTIHVVVKEEFNTLSQAARETLGMVAIEGAGAIQDCYREIWEEPKTYEFRTIQAEGGDPLYRRPGNIVLRPSDRNQTWFVDISGENLYLGTDYVDTIQLPLKDPLGMENNKRQVKSAVMAALIGLPRLAHHSFGTYLSIVSNEEELQSDWTPTDAQICHAFAALDHGSRFELSGGE
jgi:hypothetical protein